MESNSSFHQGIMQTLSAFNIARQKTHKVFKVLKSRGEEFENILCQSLYMTGLE